MRDHEEAVKQLKGNGGHSEEIEGDDRLAVILEKCQRSLTPVASAPDSS